MTAAFACVPERSRGRLHREPESAHRSAFQRDRDRIVHCSAFRRLKHKTQVFVAHVGDHFRTRLTHSIEVAQVARTISGALDLDVDLTETVALAHDLGHPPFGHAGEEELDDLMRPHGGFDHNAQALRIVTFLERHYADFDGLNLTWETLEGIAKHNGPVVGDLPHHLRLYDAEHPLELSTHASAEAQVAALSDDIAYNNHDILDGIRAGLFNLDDLSDLPILRGCIAEVDRRYPDLHRKRRRHEALRRFFGALVEDVLGETRTRLAESGGASSGEVRRAGRALVSFSECVESDLSLIRDFLFERMYRAPLVRVMRKSAKGYVRDLFPIYMDKTDLLPTGWREDIAAVETDADLARIVADHIAGMTDRFAMQEHFRLTGREGRMPDFA